jgi:hypothetical protein
MSKVVITGNASGTGDFTIAAPNSNTDRTLTLPDITGTVLTDSAGVLNIGAGQVYKDASGNVGIGTSSPLTKLVTVGTTMATSQAFVGSVADTSYSGGIINLSNSSRSIGITSDPTNAGAGSILNFSVDGSERMRINSSGNVGIGTTSPTSKLEVLDDTDINMNASGTGHLEIDGNAYNFAIALNASGANLYTNSASRHLIFGVNETEVMRVTNGNVGIGTSSPTTKLTVLSGTNAGISVNDGTVNTILYNTSSANGSLGTTTNHPMAFYANNAERMRITSAGNVGIGTTSPDSKLHTSGANIIEKLTSSTAFAAKLFVSSTTTGYGRYIAAEADNMTFGRYGNAEHMRIDSSGTFFVGTTVSNASDGGFVVSAIGTICVGNSAGSSGAEFATFRRSGTQIGSITQSGTTAVAYNTSSDYRLKEDWQPMSGSVDRVKALKPVNFAWKLDGSRVDGFLAHEAQAIVPEAVTGTKDAVDAEGKPDYQGIDQSKLVPLLTAALQEALAAIESLTARVSALEGN